METDCPTAPGFREFPRVNRAENDVRHIFTLVSSSGVLLLRRLSWQRLAVEHNDGRD